MTDRQNVITTCFLIRHGKTLANRTGVFAGHTDDPLLPEGRSQAMKAAKDLSDRNLEWIFSSPVPRAMETAEIIASVLKVQVLSETGLADISIPLWEGRTKAELMSDPDSGYDIWKQSPERFAPEVGENLASLHARAMSCLTNLFMRHVGSRFAVVTHLAVVRCMLLSLQEMPLSMYRELEIFNCVPIEIVQRNVHLKPEVMTESLSN